MTDLKAVVDEEMAKIVEQGPTWKDPALRPFYEAVISNNSFKTGLFNTMQDIAHKFAGAMMTQPSSEEEIKELLSSMAVARPALGLAYMGFLIGKAAGEKDALEKMFNPDLKEAN